MESKMDTLFKDISGQNIKIKKPDVSDFHRNTGVSCNYKLKFSKFKDLCTKNTEKVIQDE